MSEPAYFRYRTDRSDVETEQGDAVEIWALRGVKKRILGKFLCGSGILSGLRGFRVRARLKSSRPFRFRAWGFEFPTRSRIIRTASLLTIPWAPAYIFERITFTVGAVFGSSLYSVLTGPRIVVDIASFALGGLLISRLLRPRLALAQIFTSTVLMYSLFYHVCETYIGPNQLLHSACYHPGPDRLTGLRLSLLLFSLGSLSVFARMPSLKDTSRRWVPTFSGLMAGLAVSTAGVWFGLTAWFSGVLVHPFFLPVQILMLLGIPGLAGGMLAARISRSMIACALSGLFSAGALTLSSWTLVCPMCDRSLLLFFIPSWVVFSTLGGILWLYDRRDAGWFGRFLSRRIRLLRNSAVAIVILVALSQTIFVLWDPSVMHSPALSTDTGPLVLGVPAYRPYVAGYYDSVQYRICCLEIGVSFTRYDLAKIGQDNFLMAGMGVQSPNCCIDGWDFGWRADLVLLGDGSMLVSADAWETCDSNANCGGHFWQNLRYHSQQPIPVNLVGPVYLRMMWENGVVNWYYNHTGTPWQAYGSFTPDFREGRYFDIGVVGLSTNQPILRAVFFQFGVSSNKPVSDWSVILLYPSFLYEGAWRLMEKAAVIHGDYSFWKVSYRWGGAPYNGVTATANALDPSLEKHVVEFSHTGGTTATDTPLW